MSMVALVGATEPPLTCDDAWNTEHRAEAPLQRADRNFAELLQELRVAQTGVQILFAFLLTLSFMDRFVAIDPFQRGVYVFTRRRRRPPWRCSLPPSPCTGSCFNVAASVSWSGSGTGWR